MSSVPCTNCGAEITPGTKFCRRCGQPSLDTASVSEATTRVFEATAERAASPTQNWNALPTGPAYLSPTGAASPLEDASTRGLEYAGRKQNSWIAVSLIAVLIAAVLAALAVAFLLYSRTFQPTPTPPVATAPETGLPQPPPPPPPPTFNEPPASGSSVPTSELMYPGAQTVLDMKNSRDNLLQLRSADPVNKVVDWYINKLKSAEVIRTPGSDAVLRTGRTSVIISGRSGNTDIIIRQGAEK